MYETSSFVESVPLLTIGSNDHPYTGSDLQCALPTQYYGPFTSTSGFRPIASQPSLL